MFTDLLVFDDQPGVMRDLIEYLESKGYGIVRCESFLEADALIQSGRVGLLLHGVNKTKTYWGIVEDVMEAHPFFPMIHVTTEGSKREIYIPTNPFHEIHRPLTSKKDLELKIERLSFLCDLVNRWAQSTNTLENLLSFQASLEGLEKEALTGHCIEYLSSQLGAEYAIWFPEGELHKTWKAVKDKSQIPHGWKPSRPFDDETLIRYFSSWPYPKDNPKDMTYFTNPETHRKDALFPVVNPNTGELFGHFVMFRLSRPGADMLSTNGEYLMRILNQRMLLSSKFQDARRLTYTDDVTGLYNQRYLNLILDQEVSRAERAETKFSVLFIDIDFFKKVNDSGGHVLGSSMLVALGDLLSKAIRKTDFAFRYGGDEFVLVLSGADTDRAWIVAERIRDLISKTAFHAEGRITNLTVSIGVATYPVHAQTAKRLLEMADEAMYDAKRKSRNIVYLAS